MSIVVIEGSNGVGKTTIIDYLSKEYDIISKKSIPDWFRKYIVFARSCEPNIQKRIYLIGHEANYNESNDNKDYVFDRFVYSTIIRLNYQLNKSVNETINEILTLNLKPKQIFYITANKETIKERLSIRNNYQFNEEFYKYENEVYSQLSQFYDIINVINNDANLDNTLDEINNIICRKKLFLRKG